MHILVPVLFSEHMYYFLLLYIHFQLFIAVNNRHPPPKFSA